MKIVESTDLVNESPERPPFLHHRLGRRNGKVARLPKPVRDRINQMLHDGKTYQEIIEQLKPDTEGLNEENMSNWKQGGYHDWINELNISEAFRVKHEIALSLAEQSTESRAPSALIEILATNLCELLVESDPSVLRESMFSDCDKFSRFVNAMVRLAEGGMKTDLHKFKLQDLLAAAYKKAHPQKLGISEEALRAAEEALNLM
jgi:hypothetical protein